LACFMLELMHDLWSRFPLVLVCLHFELSFSFSKWESVLLLLNDSPRAPAFLVTSY
jgi:hypothetical protein